VECKCKLCGSSDEEVIQMGRNRKNRICLSSSSENDKLFEDNIDGLLEELIMEKKEEIDSGNQSVPNNNQWSLENQLEFGTNPENKSRFHLSK